MNSSTFIYALSSNLLGSFKPQRPGAFSAWLHFERDWVNEDGRAVASLIISGCRSILITGNEAEAIHDKVDYIAYDLTKDLVLTFCNPKADRDAAFEFIVTRCPEAEPSFFLLSVFSEDCRFSTLSLGENLKLLGLEMSHS